MNWLEKILPSISSGSRKQIPEGIWNKCPKCDSTLYNEELVRLLHVCPKCDHHMRLSGRQRLESFLDPKSSVEFGQELKTVDPLKFRDQKKYRDRYLASQKSTQESEAIITMSGLLQSMPVIVAAFEFRFMGGSMGSVVGERFLRAVQRCIDENVPFITFSSSGGARMQEGLVSLMQMSKTALAIKMLDRHSIPYISVLTDPTMGGVTASFAMLGDIQIAEPKALIGFAGPEVVKQTVRQQLPEGFQRSEFLLEKGMVDLIVHRTQMRDVIYQLLSILRTYKTVN